ncbi:hypothetical protein Drorol1_Dr00016878 [Drosera rotundifolia]
MTPLAGTAAPTPCFLFKNGAAASPPLASPPVTTFLETHPGAYTATRTFNNAASLLFWDRHVRRLPQSLRTLLTSNPKLLFGPRIDKELEISNLGIDLEAVVRGRVGETMREAVRAAMRERKEGEELMVTALIGGNVKRLGEIGGVVEGEEELGRILDVYVHVGMFMVTRVGVEEEEGACLAVVRGRRDVALAKYSDWVRLRKPLEKMKPVTISEALLSEDGDKLLEGCRTNFFIVSLKENCHFEGENSHAGAVWASYEVQTAPLQDSVLPGVVRKLVIEICISKGITVREVSPSWSARETWEEAFITNSVRLVQHVVRIQAPKPWTSLQSKVWEEVSWEEKQFKRNPGIVTALIQKEIIEIAHVEGYPLVLV